MAALVGGHGNAQIREPSVVPLIEYVHDPYPFSADVGPHSKDTRNGGASSHQAAVTVAPPRRVRNLKTPPSSAGIPLLSPLSLPQLDTALDVRSVVREEAREDPLES